ncbi:hypothetical protein DXG01_012982 [Tephrocybe rancida]|nr:hypothetical protein DXG01_012982 [Tephrocybe rancida]
MASNIPEHRSTRQRDPNALAQRQEALSELISQPGQSGRRPPAPAPTQGERGQALAAQQRRAKKTRGAAPRTNTSTQPAVAPVPLPLVTDDAGIESDHNDDGGEDDGNFVRESDASDGDGDATLRAPPNLQMLQNLALHDEPTSLDPGGPGLVWSSGSGADTESMLALLNVPDIPRYGDFQLPFSAPHQATTLTAPHQVGASSHNLTMSQTAIPSEEYFFTGSSYTAHHSPVSQTQPHQHTHGSESEPSWEPDPLPPNSTMYTSNAQVGLIVRKFKLYA